MPSPSAALIASELVVHPHAQRLAAYVRTALLEAARAREPARIGVANEGEPAPTGEEADTEYGNVITILGRGPVGPTEHALIAALLARGVAARVPDSPDDWQELAGQLAWLGAHTSLTVFEALEVALSNHAVELWRALGALAQDPEALGYSRAEALVAATALVSTGASMALEIAGSVAELSSDPLVAAACRGSPGATCLKGELRSVPPGAFMTLLLALSGLLLLWRVLSLFTRYALAWRRPAELRLTRRGLELDSSTFLLGRLLQKRRIFVPIRGLARATREAKYSRAGLYAGLTALMLSSYLGMGLFVDGLRVPGTSPSLLGAGVLLVTAGLCVDFGLTRLTDAVRGHCRLVVVPRKGKSFCIGGLEQPTTDQVLNEIARQPNEVPGPIEKSPSPLPHPAPLS